MFPDDCEIKASKTLSEYVRNALREARARRPASFYFLLAIPLVLILGVHMIEFRENPVRFLLVLSLLFLFFGIVALRAVADLFDIARRHVREKPFQETLGDADFISELGNRVREERDRQEGSR